MASNTTITTHHPHHHPPGMIQSKMVVASLRVNFSFLYSLFPFLSEGITDISAKPATNKNEYQN
jgi:hypothetical protein